MFFLLGFGLVWGQNSKELSDPPKFIIASPKEKAPSLILPKKKKSFLSEDYFNPQIEFKDPKRDIENPRLLFGENEQFLAYFLVKTNSFWILENDMKTDLTENLKTRKIPINLNPINI